MATNGRAKRDPVALDLAGGLSIKAAGKRHAIGERTIRRWLAEDQEFRDLVQLVRTRLFSKAVGTLSRLSNRAAGRLGKLLGNVDARVALGAARTILTAAMASREATDVLEQLVELKKQIQELRSGKSKKRAGPAAGPGCAAAPGQ